MKRVDFQARVDMEPVRFELAAGKYGHGSLELAMCRPYLEVCMYGVADSQRCRYLGDDLHVTIVYEKLVRGRGDGSEGVAQPRQVGQNAAAPLPLGHIVPPPTLSSAVGTTLKLYCAVAPLPRWRRVGVHHRHQHSSTVRQVGVDHGVWCAGLWRDHVVGHDRLQHGVMHREPGIARVVVGAVWAEPLKCGEKLGCVMADVVCDSGLSCDSVDQLDDIVARESSLWWHPLLDGRRDVNARNCRCHGHLFLVCTLLETDLPLDG